METASEPYPWERAVKLRNILLLLAFGFGLYWTVGRAIGAMLELAW
jgi:hypothetical protein